ncbi:hypothetical protein Gogos_001601, partial [Gossypium gossypioides]|nr:hypothetical protein [Gossypium gossypioides]
SQNQCSHLWRSLSKIWPLFHENLIWSIRDGATARCWKNPWILDVICRITSIPPSHSESGSDKVIWARSTSGAFSIRRAYWTLKETTWNSRDKYWKSIWKYLGPRRQLKWLRPLAAGLNNTKHILVAAKGIILVRI